MCSCAHAIFYYCKVRYKYKVDIRDVCSSLVAHMAAVAATWVRILPNNVDTLQCKTRDGVRDPGNRVSPHFASKRK